MIPFRSLTPTITSDSNSNKRRLNQCQEQRKNEDDHEVVSDELKMMTVNFCQNYDDCFIQHNPHQPNQQQQQQKDEQYFHERKFRRRIICSSNGISNKYQRSRRRSILCDKNINVNNSRHNICLGIIFLCAIVSSYTPTPSTSFLCYAQEQITNHPYHPSISIKTRRRMDGNNANDEDDFYKFQDDDTYTPVPTKKPTFPPTPHPTKYPTYSPTARPSSEPTRSGDDFYEVQIDDYTVEAQSAEIYVSSMTDVILCLLCTFFWVLWLVGTIFPTKIQHLYKSEGIVVIGDVLESYVTLGGGGGSGAARAVGGGEGSPMININNDDGEFDPDMHAGAGDTFDELNDIPSYHAIVSYVVPGPIAVGRRRKAKATSTTKQRYELQHEQTMSTSNYFLQSNESENFKMATKSLHPITTEDHAMEELNSKLSVSVDHVKATMQVMKGTPPRPPRTSSAINNNTQISPKKTSPRSRSASPDSLRVHDGMRNRQLSKISEEGRNADNNHGVKNLLDSCTKSFDTALSIKEQKKLHEEMQKLGYYRYNRNNKTEYTSKDDPDEYEDPELIGNLFHSLGLSSMVMKRTKGSDKEASPVRVKKRFETNELLNQGSKNVEIIVLPGNPGSGILKSEFELEEDYMLNGTVSSDLDGSRSPGDILGDANGGQMGDITAGIIGVVLASVSVIGAVHGVLTLPYQIRACK